MRRAKDGWVRDVHGDLHCEHVCFAPEGIQIFDCIEFNADLRQCDLASEIAFLTMDIEVRGGESLVGDFLARYGALLGDRDLPELLPFFKCYRALVRGKVHALRSQGADSTAARYCRFALRYTWEPVKPFLLIIGGLTGSGKSTVARELGARLGMPVINSDTVRKAMAGKSGPEIARFNEGIYSPRVTEQTYAKMARVAEKQILSGTGAILDATFGRRAHREKIRRLAEKHQIPLAVIICSASEDTTKARLARRTAAGKDISDGRWEIYLEQKPAYEPVVEVSRASLLEIDTEPSLKEITRACESFLRAFLRQPGSAVRTVSDST
jgi:predicted kinase